MTMITEYTVPVPLLTPKGRVLLFTPERIEQIRNLRERGKTVDEIAELIGCTVGTLRVRCSQLGISLKNAVPTIMQKKGKNGNSEQEFKPANGDSAEFTPIETPKKSPPLAPAPSSDAIVSLQLSSHGRTKTVPFNISSETLAALMMMAELHNMRFADLLALIINRIVQYDLVEQVLRVEKGDLPAK